MQILFLCLLLLHLGLISGSVLQKPTVSIDRCDKSGIDVVLRNYHTDYYRGTPYVKDYEDNKDCVKAFLYDPITHEHIIQFKLDYTGVGFEWGASVYHPYSTICGTLITDDISYDQGSFETTLVLPVSKYSIESQDDYLAHVYCTWGGHSGNKTHTNVHRHSHTPDVTMNVLNESKAEVSGVLLGDEIQVHIDTHHYKPGQWDVLNVLSLTALNSDDSQRLLLVEDGCLVGEDEIIHLQPSFLVTQRRRSTLKLKAFRFRTDPVVKYEANIRMCSSRDEYSLHKCQADCITKKKGKNTTHHRQKKPVIHVAQEPRRKSNFETTVSAVVLVRNQKTIVNQNGKHEDKKENNDVTYHKLKDPYPYNAVLCLDDGELALAATVLFIVTMSVVTATGTVIFHQYTLQKKKGKLSNNKKYYPMSPSSKSTIPYEENPIVHSWLANRVITPPPATNPASHSVLKFSSSFSPVSLSKVKSLNVT